MSETAERNKVLRDFNLSEAYLRQLKALGHEEATWRNEHELKVMLGYVKERHAFIRAEIDLLLPAKPRRVREPNEGAVQSHRFGPGLNGSSHYGEKFG